MANIFYNLKVLGVTEYRTRQLLFKNIFYEEATLYTPVNKLVVLFSVLYDSLWLTNVNEQNIKKKKWAFARARSLLDEVENDQSRDEPDEKMDINHDKESKFEESDENMKLFELKGKFSNAT
ncbi:hypothetical protein TNCV_3336481 [Trichonephila clavipes]|nr:hypothetical protein TNCV_3336481 [Trichonephila clavipes]